MRRPLIPARLGLVVLLGGCAPPQEQDAFDVPQWAFPTVVPSGPASATPPSTTPDPFVTADSVQLLGVPGAAPAYTRRQVLDRNAPVDWFPGTHPAPPRIVMQGRRPDTWACGFCHLPDGQGRPENAMLAGLPAEYIVRQWRAFADDSRRMASPLARTTHMNRLSKLYTEPEVREAALYFSRLTPVRLNRVIEDERVPRHRALGRLNVRDGDGTEPIAGRLIEMPESTERHELHDPTVRYETYVPPGTLVLGARLAKEGPAGVATACVTCHGPALLGVGQVPPLAGRSPQYLLRQLINFRTGARATAEAAPMKPVVEAMTIGQMVAAAAYAGSLRPAP